MSYSYSTEDQSDIEDEDDEEAVSVEWEHPCPFAGEPTKVALGERCPHCGVEAEDCTP